MPTNHPANNMLKRANDPIAQDPDLAHACGLMLIAYCDWLNLWAQQDGPVSFNYEPRQFLDSLNVSTDPSNPTPEGNLYGHTRPCATYESSGHRIYAFVTDNGDDGGSATLTGWFAVTTIWGDGDWKAAHKEGYPKPVGYIHTLVHMMQEFDTRLTIIMHDCQLVHTPTHQTDDPHRRTNP